MEKTITIPEGVEIEVEGFKVKVVGPLGSLERDFFSPLFKDVIKIEKVDDKVVIKASSERRKIKAMLGTIYAHLRNMIKGVKEGYTYKMKIVYVHFPMSVEVKGKEVIIKNFLGEKTVRKAEIVGDVKVEVKDNELIIQGINKEEVGQTAANIEQATRVTGKDRRVFQDGIYIVSKE
jgi:large subunit ribosomal protein L6